MSFIETAISNINSAVEQYRNRISNYERIVEDIRALPGLQVNRVSKTYVEGEKIVIECDVLINFRDRNYPTPLKISFPFSYPTVAPILFLRIPNPKTQSVKANHACVEESGKANLKELTNWGPDSVFSTLFIEMKFAFQNDYPIRQQPRNPGGQGGGSPGGQNPGGQGGANPGGQNPGGQSGQIVLNESIQSDPIQELWKGYSKEEEIDFNKEYLVRRKSDSLQFVAKIVLYPESMIESKDKDPVEQKRKRGEMLQAWQGVHPNVIRCFQTLLGLDKMVLVLEYCPNKTLKEIIDKQKDIEPFSNDDIYKAVVQIGRGIKAIHDKKVVHRDLEPKNIAVSADWVYKIANFESSIQLEDPNAAMKTMIGREYAAAEILQGIPYTPSVDIYSFGVILFEMIMLMNPFSKITKNKKGEEVVRFEQNRVYEGRPNKLESRVHNPKLLELVSSMIAKDPGDRPSIDAVLEKDFIKEYIGRTHA